MAFHTPIGERDVGLPLTSFYVFQKTGIKSSFHLGEEWDAWTMGLPQNREKCWVLSSALWARSKLMTGFKGSLSFVLRFCRESKERGYYLNDVMW